MLRSLLSCLTGLGLLALAACGGAYALTDAEQTNAELGARSYAERVEGAYVSCSGSDSDGDGYVSCDVRTDGGVVGIACAYETRGCKAKAAALAPSPFPPVAPDAAAIPRSLASVPDPIADPPARSAGRGVGASRPV